MASCNSDTVLELSIIDTEWAISFCSFVSITAEALACSSLSFVIFASCSDFLLSNSFKEFSVSSFKACREVSLLLSSSIVTVKVSFFSFTPLINSLSRDTILLTASNLSKISVKLSEASKYASILDIRSLFWIFLSLLLKIASFSDISISVCSNNALVLSISVSVFAICVSLSFSFVFIWSISIFIFAISELRDNICSSSKSYWALLSDIACLSLSKSSA